MNGKDDRLIIVIGPCSIHDPQAALDYCERLYQASEKHKGELLIVMRAYLEKPRTTVGWKGLINDPDIDGTFHINKGLRIARKLFVQLTSKLPIAGEMLDTISPQFYLIYSQWGYWCKNHRIAIAQRVGIWIIIPSWIQNGTDGTLGVTIDALRAASHPHHFLSVTKPGVVAIVGTDGNQDCLLY